MNSVLDSSLPANMDRITKRSNQRSPSVPVATGAARLALIG